MFRQLAMVSFVMFHVDEHKCDVAISGFADAPDIVATAGQLQLPVLALHAFAIQGIQMHKWQMYCHDACHMRQTDNHDS